MAKGDWFYNSVNGKIAQQELIPIPHPAALGWHGPFATKQAAIDYYNANKAAHTTWQAPTDSSITALGNTPDAAAAGITQGLGLSNENITSWMIRIGEILLGIVLVGVGIAKLTGTTNMVASAVKARI